VAVKPGSVKPGSIGLKNILKRFKGLKTLNDLIPDPGL
jgi:hypothetical protein